jgi:hypothetical protein
MIMMETFPTYPEPGPSQQGRVQQGPKSPYPPATDPYPPATDPYPPCDYPTIQMFQLLKDLKRRHAELERAIDLLERAMI